MKVAARYWVGLLNDLNWSETIKKRCDKEGINWRVLM